MFFNLMNGVWSVKSKVGLVKNEDPQTGFGTGLEYPADLLKFEVCSDSLFFRFWVTSWISLSLYEIQKNKRFWVTSWVSLSLYEILKNKCPLIQFLNIHVSSWNDGFFTQFHSYFGWMWSTHFVWLQARRLHLLDPSMIIISYHGITNNTLIPLRFRHVLKLPPQAISVCLRWISTHLPCHFPCWVGYYPAYLKTLRLPPRFCQPG